MDDSSRMWLKRYNVDMTLQTLHFEITVQAPRQKVWDTMLSGATYQEWTKPFNPSTSPDAKSIVSGDWQEGSKMLFIGVDENGQEGGMVSRIKERREPAFLSVQHIGILKDGVEDTTSEEATKWSPAFENYTFEESNGGTLLKIDVDMMEEYKEMFSGMWPKALAILKEIAEK